MKSNTNLSLEISSLKELNEIKDNEILNKNQQFELFMKKFKEKLERAKDKLQETQRFS